MNHKQLKFENPLRIEELKPTETLKKIGLEENHVICDIGAGSGIFTIPASMITNNKVYALEINDEMLSVIGEKAKSQGIKNIQLIKVQDENFDMEDHSVDIVIMVTVLHEIENKFAFLGEVKRILSENGRIAVIEFHKWQTPMGPPTEHRMSKDEVIDHMKDIGYAVKEDIDLGENYYCLVFIK